MKRFKYQLRDLKLYLEMLQSLLTHQTPGNKTYKKISQNDLRLFPLLRYSHLKGKFAFNPFNETLMPIIFDDKVSPSFETGKKLE